MAGTNDMESSNPPSTEGNDPHQATNRLGLLVDQINRALPKTVVLVAQILDVKNQESQWRRYDQTN